MIIKDSHYATSSGTFKPPKSSINVIAICSYFGFCISNIIDW